MKKYVFLIFAIFIVFLVGCSQAEVSMQNKESAMKQENAMMEKEKNSMENKMEEDSMKSMGNGYEMENGQMIVIDSQTHEESMMKSDAMLDDGTKVMVDGKVMRQNGETFMLKEHESMWQDGTFMTGEEHMDDSSMMENKESMMKGEEKKSSTEYKGKVLAGTKSKYLEFNNEDYEKALKENKKILLYFYASWCPTCKAEQPEAIAAFNEINNPNLVGFRVNYKDSDTDSYEEELAKQFAITYQHTKIILVDGKIAKKSLESWKKQDYLNELA